MALVHIFEEKPGIQRAEATTQKKDGNFLIYTWLLVCGQSVLVTLLETNISPTKALLKMIFLVLSWVLPVLWRVYQKYL